MGALEIGCTWDPLLRSSEFFQVEPSKIKFISYFIQSLLFTLLSPVWELLAPVVFLSAMMNPLLQQTDGVGVDEKLSLRRVAVVEDFFDIIYSMHVETGPNGEQIRKHAGQKRTYKAVNNGKPPTLVTSMIDYNMPITMAYMKHMKLQLLNSQQDEDESSIESDEFDMSDSTRMSAVNSDLSSNLEERMQSPQALHGQQDESIKTTASYSGGNFLSVSVETFFLYTQVILSIHCTVLDKAVKVEKTGHPQPKPSLTCSMPSPYTSLAISSSCSYLFFLLHHRFSPESTYTHDVIKTLLRRLALIPLPPDSSVHEISLARILEWVAISSSGGSS
ncbi:hypothetical protein FD755_009740 [Muntiacus reevesi]|uniref:Uncharacterized protein n=1 Tax=Muntiacus reevesi TaxID=9886 RepID=A0A5N3XW56_MUNRE|nr:hypothetical protein FD755_009740 [Muntiacus reevesi]